jgi:cellobiose-specific phosphotransferase system component IIB
MRNRKIIKRGENSFAIALMAIDMQDFGMAEGDIVDIDDINLIRCEVPKKKK